MKIVQHENTDEICPLVNNEDNHNSRYNPKNAKHAYCFTLHDTVRNLLAPAWMNDDKYWNQQLDILQTQIDSARKV